MRGRCARNSDSRSRTTPPTDRMPRRPRRSSLDISSRRWSWPADMGKPLVVLGVIIAAVGVLVMLGVPIGRLPGDITVRRGNFTFYFPLATSIIASLLLTLILSLLRR